MKFLPIYLKVCTRGVCIIYINKKNDRENRKICYQVRIEGPYPVEKLQRTRGNIQSNRQIRSQVGVGEAPNKTQE